MAGAIFNARLADDLDSLPFEVHRLEAHALSEAVLADPASFGFIAPKGHGHLRRVYRQLAGGDEFTGLPGDVTQLFALLHEEAAQLTERIAASTARLKELVEHDETCALAMSVPHLGPVNGASLGAVLEAPDDFRNGRAFAAYLGLVPRQHASGEKAPCAALPNMARHPCAALWFWRPRPC